MTNNAPTSELRLTALLSDTRLLVLLFVSFRFLMLIVYQPLMIDGFERGVTAQGDYSFYYELVQLSDDGLYPYRDWWVEFPPVWYTTITALYQMQGENVNYSSWAMQVGLLLIAFDTGNLLLVLKIGTHLHGASTGMSLAWIYAVLLAPASLLFWTFETLVAFCMLLGLWWLLKKRDMPSAVAAALGALTKLTPALLIGAVFRFRGLPAAVRYTGILIGIFVLGYVPFLLQNTEMALPSLTAQFNKSSYQTVWALLDGNYGTGVFGDIVRRFDPTMAAETLGKPAVIPGIVRLAAAGAIGLFVYLRTRRFDDKGLVAFVGITLLIFFLQAQGWSPQWLVQIIPLVLLAFPNRNSVMVIIVLSLLTFIEYPFLFIRTGDTGGYISGALMLPFVMLVVARTALLAGICVAFYRRLRQEPIPN